MRIAIALAVVAALASSALAETRDERTLALGWMTENADAVVLGRAGEEGLLFVDESFRGSLGAGTTVVVVHETHGEASPWTKGAVLLAFLKKVPVPEGAPPRWAPVSGAFSLKAVLAEGPEARFPAVVRSLCSFLDAEGAVAKPDGLREHLVAGMEDADPGLAWSAATDFLRHGELHEGLAPEQAGRIVAAFRRQPVGKRTKEALALAAAATRDPGATRALVDALEDPRARLVRVAVGEALRRRKDPAAAKLLLARLSAGGPAQRADALRVLGLAGVVEGAPAARERLADASAEVRTEAAQALGLLARAAREADPAARLAGTADLAKAAAAPGNEGRAALWALAQMDEAEAWAALRKFAADDPREEVRRYAGRYLKHPRQSLILE
jgi:hypothetical protein